MVWGLSSLISLLFLLSGCSSSYAPPQKEDAYQNRDFIQKPGFLQSSMGDLGKIEIPTRAQWELYQQQYETQTARRPASSAQVFPLMENLPPLKMFSRFALVRVSMMVVEIQRAAIPQKVKEEFLVQLKSWAAMKSYVFFNLEKDLMAQKDFEENLGNYYDRWILDFNLEFQQILAELGNQTVFYRLSLRNLWMTAWDIQERHDVRDRELLRHLSTKLNSLPQDLDPASSTTDNSFSDLQFLWTRVFFLQSE